MLCDQCNEQSATVFVTQIIHGESTRRKLCESCAAPVLAQIPKERWSFGMPSDESLQKALQRPPECPAEIAITDPISVRDLAAALRGRYYQVIAVLIQHNIFKTANDPLDFATASLVCEHYGVTPHKAS